MHASIYGLELFFCTKKKEEKPTGNEYHLLCLIGSSLLAPTVFFLHALISQVFAKLIKLRVDERTSSVSNYKLLYSFSK